MFSMNLPHGVCFLLSRLRLAGFRADVVGGSVRDALLGMTPDDYDITTAATPEETKEVFSDLRVIETGILHGTVTVLFENIPYEITTYRVDGEYRDGRHPVSVGFTRTLSEDLARRDFTMNALCYNPEDGLTDLFGGREDIKLHTVRAVGDPAVRFSEDALRILRAIRFAAKLGFSVEEETDAALRRKAPLLSRVSAERICAEWTKLLSGKSCYDVLASYREVVAVFLPELAASPLPPREGFDAAEPSVRFLSLFLPGRTPCEAAAAFEIATRRLKTDAATRKTGTAVLRAFDAPTLTDADLLRLASENGVPAAEKTLALRTLFAPAEKAREARFRLLISSHAPYRISDLAVNGRDLLSIGLSGEQIGRMQNLLLSAVIDGRVENEKTALLSFAKKNGKD